ncbi:MAG: glycosyltransferase [Alphaproteobacteria bacterium]|nr:glycosyltransferase [Alphaproteobacteria bacterium]
MKISVIIPVYNALEDVQKCLESVKKNFDFSNGEVILVDDCSQEETAAYLKKEAATNPDKFTLIRNAENSGFPKTCNNGIARAQGEITVLLNSDTIIPAGFCEKIAACFDSDPQIAVASPIASYSGSYFIPLRDGETVASMNEKIEQLHRPAYPTIPTAEGFCLCLRKHAIDTYGALDEVYGKGFNEERDLSFRMVKNGLRCTLIDNLYVYHKRHASFGSAERKKQLEKNDKIFKERWGNLVDQEKDFTKHHNPIDALRRQIQPKYFKKGLFYTKSVLPDKTVWRIFGVKITLKHTDQKI